MSTATNEARQLAERYLSETGIREPIRAELLAWTAHLELVLRDARRAPRVVGNRIYLDGRLRADRQRRIVASAIARALLRHHGVPARPAAVRLISRALQTGRVRS